jgi:hypothetical protein
MLARARIERRRRCCCAVRTPSPASVACYTPTRRTRSVAARQRAHGARPPPARNARSTTQPTSPVVRARGALGPYRHGRPADAQADPASWKRNCLGAPDQASVRCSVGRRAADVTASHRGSTHETPSEPWQCRTSVTGQREQCWPHVFGAVTKLGFNEGVRRRQELWRLGLVGGLLAAIVIAGVAYIAARRGHDAAAPMSAVHEVEAGSVWGGSRSWASHAARQIPSCASPR